MRENPKLKVGDTIWRFNENRRVYLKKNGELCGSLIYREHFDPQVITGETPRSWIVGEHAWSKQKAPKKRPNGWCPWYYSLAEVEDACYVHENGHKIQAEVGRCNDAALLRKIAALLEDGKK